MLFACKANKTITKESGVEGLTTKFERLYIEACTQSIIGNYTTALSQFNKCSDIRPDEASVYYQIGKIRQNTANLNAAFQNASKANSLAPDNKFYALFYAEFLKNNGDYNKAVEILEISIKANPKDENLYNTVDAIYEIQNQTDKRIALWNKFIKNTGLKTGTGMKLVALYKLKKDYTSAHTMYDELKKAAPNKISYYIDDARLYELQNDTLNAKLNFEMALQTHPANWDASYALYQYYAGKNDRKNAEKYFRIAFENSSASIETKIPVCQQLILQIRVDSEKCPLALIAANAMVKNSEMDSKALFTAAELFENCEKYEEASLNYRKACDIDPNLFDAWVRSMDCMLRLKKYGPATEIGESAIEYFPFTVALYEILARAYNLNSEYLKAYETALGGEKLGFDDELKSKLLLQKGISMYFQKRYKEALLETEKGIAINKVNAELYDLQGNIHYQLDDINKAVECWKKAKELGLKNSLIDRKINEKKAYD